MTRIWLFAIFLPATMGGAEMTPMAFADRINCTSAEALSPDVRCCTLTEDTDISPWFTEENLKERLGKLQIAEKNLTIANLQNVETICLPTVTNISRLVLANNPHLKRLEAWNLVKHGVVEDLHIENCPQLDQNDIYDLYKATFNKKTVIDNCETTHTGRFDKKIMLGACKKITGNFTLEKVGDIEKNEFGIKEINGCLNIKDTNLTNLEFLEFVKIHNCTGEHLLHNNVNLCPHEYLTTDRMTKTKTTGRHREHGCSRTCSSSKFFDFKKARCVKFIGTLIIGEEFPRYRYMELKEIEGQLIIDGTSHEELTFPKLEKIRGEKAPLLHVTNNPKLKTLSMPFPSILEHSSVRPSRVIVIERNPLLSAEQFLQKEALNTCSKNETRRCYYDKSTNVEKVVERGLRFYLEPTIMVVLIILAHLLICLPTWWMRLGKDSYDEQQQEEWNKVAEKAKAGSNAALREMMRKNRNGRPSGILRVDKTQPDKTEEEIVPNVNRSNYGTTHRETRKKNVTFKDTPKMQEKPETPRKSTPATSTKEESKNMMSMESLTAQGKSPATQSDGSPKTVQKKSGKTQQTATKKTDETPKTGTKKTDEMPKTGIKKDSEGSPKTQESDKDGSPP